MSARISSGQPCHVIPHQWVGKYLKLASVLLVFNVVSALLFISLVDRPVFDDTANLPDVYRYATHKISLDTIRVHKNPTGPASFIWMAAAIRIFKGNGLRDARFAVLFSWLLLGIGIVIGTRYSAYPRLWHAALFVTLAFPHALTATATVLTEGPAMLFAILGLFAWTESVIQPNMTPKIVLLGLIGGLSIGISITCRQYYLALLPAMALFALSNSRVRTSQRKSFWLFHVILSLAVAIFPVALLVVTWKGLSSPGMVSGLSYNNWTSKVGFNSLRPIVASFYIGLYLIPLTLPAIMRMGPVHHTKTLALALLGGIVAAFFRSSLLQPGPLKSLIQFIAQTSTGQCIILGIVGGVTTYNSVALCSLIWQRRAELLSCSPFVLAFLAVIFFITEQVGIGGNIPFYELYVLQIAPFLGMIAFAALPCLTRQRVVALAFLSMVGEILLWRYAFI